MIHLIPLTAIDPAALPRDRSTLDADALAELQASICTTGLRQPIEVWRLSHPQPPYEYGLISGLRRLTAHKNLAALRANGDFTTVAAFIRQPTSIPAALALMIEENEARADLSPCEKGHILIECVSEGHFDSVDQALKALHPSASRQKRARLRSCAAVVEELDGKLTTPEHMPERHLLRLAAALRGGFVEVIHDILKDTMGHSQHSQWSALLPTLTEADHAEEETPATATSPSRPRRLLHLKQGLTIRREEFSDGYLLRFSGPEAKPKGLMDDVMDQIERWFQPH